MILGKLYIGLPVISISGDLRTGYTTVSAKIPRRLKELLDKYNIEVGPVIRAALEDEVKKRMIEELEALLGEIKEEISKISDEEIVELIREDRGGR